MTTLCSAGYNYFWIRHDGIVRRCMNHAHPSQGEAWPAYSVLRPEEFLKPERYHDVKLTPCSQDNCFPQCDGLSTIQIRAGKTFIGDVVKRKPKRPVFMAQCAMANKCNFTCAYCDFSDVDDPIGKGWLHFWEYVVEHYASGDVRMVGGEPSLHPMMVDVAKIFARRKPDFTLSLFSNMSNSKAVLEMADILGPALCFNASCHPDDMRFHRGRFFDAVSQTLARGAVGQISMVLYSTTIGLVPLIQRECKKIGVNLILQPCLGFPMTEADERLSASLQNTVKEDVVYNFDRMYPGWEKNTMDGF